MREYFDKLYSEKGERKRCVDSAADIVSYGVSAIESRTIRA